jgi:TolB-like protein
MAHKTNSFQRFWKELKRRKVVHVITVYAAVSFVILQLVDIVEQPLLLPDWTTALVIILLCIGFVIAVFLSWVYDITPTGVKKTKQVSAVKNIDQKVVPASNGWKIATYISAIIILSLVAFNFNSRRNLNADISKLEKSIAVLPFINDSPVDSNKYFINGIMEEVLNNLQKIKDFRVLSRTSTDQYKGQDRPTISEIAKKLNVNYVVEGSGQKYGNAFRLRVQLIKAKGKENHLWAKSYEQEIKEIKDIFRVQSQIAQSIAEELKATITPEEKQGIEKTPTASLTAHDFYMRGNEEKNKYSSKNPPTRVALERANELYKKAIDVDPEFAQAYLGIAQVYWDKHYWESYFSQNFLDSVLILLNKALSIDDQLAEAYTAKGWYYSQKGLTEQAVEEYDKALKYNPNDYLAYYYKGFAFFVLEDYVKCLDNFHKAILRNRSLDLPRYLRSLAYYYLDAGFSDKAKYYYDEAFTLDRDSAEYLGNLSWIEFNLENFEEALELRKRASKIDDSPVGFELYYFLPSNYDKEAYLNAEKMLEFYKKTGDLPLDYSYRIGIAFWRVGKKKEAEFYFNQQIRYDEETIKLGRWRAESGGSFYDLAATFAFLGDKEKAYIYLNEFNKRKVYPIWWPMFMRNEPFFDNIRNEDRFKKILKNVESKYQAEHERVKKWLEEQGMLN